MDSLDVRIVSTLQKQGNISMAKLSDKVGLSLSACHRRVKILEAEGRIEGYGARLNRKKIGLSIQVFIEVKLNSQREEDISNFESAIKRMPQVLECHFISGEFDYLIRVAAKNPEDYEQLYRNNLAHIPSVQQLKTLVSLSTVKEFTGYHLD